MMNAITRRSFLFKASLLAGGVSLTAVAKKSTPDFVIAETGFGKIRGIKNRGINIFKGIPYGADTSGRNRFMAPKDPAYWTGIRDTLEYGQTAPQSIPKKIPIAEGKNESLQKKVKSPFPYTPSIYRALEVAGNKPNEEGEDCLVLNIWTPALNDGQKRPVMIWLHGGGFGSGSGSNVGWDGTNLSLRGDVVVITINHRLNVMGFANLSSFSADFADSGDVGMLDIVHALRWVQINITEFGGDPNRVLIFGQSGGGRKCEVLLAMPSANGLFHRAVIESGVAIKVATVEQATGNAEILLEKLGISKKNFIQIQKLPLAKIMEAYFSITRKMGRDQAISGFVPSAGNSFLPEQPFYPVASAVSSDIPIIIGSTRTETTGLTTDTSLWYLDEKGLQVKVKDLMGDQSTEIIRLYKTLNETASPSDLYFLIASDYTYNAPTMKIAERRAALHRGAVYQYYFVWETPVQNGLLKSPHNIEWPFAFDNTKLCSHLTGGGDDAIALADKVSDAWIAFARTGNPNNPKLPNWPEFNAAERPTMVFNNTCRVINDPLKEQRMAMFRVLNYS